MTQPEKALFHRREACIDPTLQRLCSILSERIPEGAIVLADVPVSCFITVKALTRAHRTDPEEFDACRYGRLSAAIVECIDNDRARGCILLAAVVGESRHERAIRTLLHAYQAPQVTWSSTASATAIAKRVQETLSFGRKAVLPSGPLRSGERLAAFRVKQALRMEPPDGVQWPEELRRWLDDWRREHSYVVWPERALSSYISCDHPADALPPAEKNLRDYFYKGTVDILVSSGPPENYPLFVVEKDSTGHDEPDQQERDAKKDEIHRRAGIPLIRVRMNDIRPPGTVLVGAADYLAHHWPDLQAAASRMQDHEALLVEKYGSRLREIAKRVSVPSLLEAWFDGAFLDERDFDHRMLLAEEVMWSEIAEDESIASLVVSLADEYQLRFLPADARARRQGHSVSPERVNLYNVVHMRSGKAGTSACVRFVREGARGEIELCSGTVSITGALDDRLRERAERYVAGEVLYEKLRAKATDLVKK